MVISKEIRQQVRERANFLVIRGKTPMGRATCDRLDLNDQKHNEGTIVKARRFWIQGG